MCEALSDRLFAVGDDGVARVLADEVPGALAALAAEAVATCPSQALRLEH
ncbi:ferredoxin [Streptomyces roseolus]